jgi:hypothetical protein
MRTRRNGYQTAEDITVNTTTTAHQIEANFLAGTRLNLSDRLITSLATGISTLRGDRIANLPDEDTEMYLQIRSLNGTSAPTATTWTLGIMSVSDYAVQPVAIVQSEPGARQQTETTGTVAASQSGTWTVLPGNTANTTPWLVTSRSNIFFNDSTTPLGIGATLTGTARDTGIAAGTAQPFGRFNAFVLTDQTGTLRIEASNDNVTYRRASIDTAVAANVPLELTIRVSTRYHRLVLVNGGVAQTILMANTSYTNA